MGGEGSPGSLVLTVVEDMCGFMGVLGVGHKHWMVYVYISVHLTKYVGYGRSTLPRKRITEVSPPYSFTGECPRHVY